MKFTNCLKCNKELRYKLGFNYTSTKNAWCCEIFYSGLGYLNYKTYNIYFKEKEDIMLIYTGYGYELNNIIYSQDCKSLPPIKEIEKIIENLIFK